MLIERYKQILDQNCLLNISAGPLLVGVSGGADSLCLLDVLYTSGYPLVVAHFDHHLRPTSSHDAEVVRVEANRRNLPFVLGSGEVANWASEHKTSLEDAARSCRYQFLFQQARKLDAQAVVVGHTADDQVETILMHLIRGSGLTGLTGIDFRSLTHGWDARIPLVRPLLSTWREETVNYCREQGLPYVTDETNSSPAFFRNRVRLELIPILETYNPQVKSAIWRMSQSLSGDQQMLHQVVQAAWQTALAGQGASYIRLDLAFMTAQSEAMQRALLRRAVQALRPALADIGFMDIERVLDFLHRPPRSRHIDWLQGLWLEIEAHPEGQDFLILFEDSQEIDLLRSRPYPQIPEGEVLMLPIPGELYMPDGWVLSTELVEGADPAAAGLYSPADAWLDAGSAAAPLIVRRARPGERFKPLGMAGHSLKLSDFLINQKIPRALRAGWPLVCCGDEIAWVTLLRLAEPFRLTSATRLAVHTSIKKV